MQAEDQRPQQMITASPTDYWEDLLNTYAPTRQESLVASNLHTLPAAAYVPYFVV